MGNSKLTRKFQSLIGTVQLEYRETGIPSFLLVSIPYRYGTTFKGGIYYVRRISYFVSIPYRYGTTSKAKNIGAMTPEELFQSLIGTVQLFRRRFYDTHYHVSIPYRYGTTTNMGQTPKEVIVSIPYRYGTTTVFTAFLLLLYALFFTFQPFSVKKVGRSQFSKSQQTRIFAAFF